MKGRQIEPDEEPAVVLMPRLLTAEKLAALCDISPQTLHNWRSTRKGPPFVKLGHHVRYPATKAIDWINANTTTPKN
jgi:predicted DNA-binding transcriptional regulator AlpA